MPRVFGLRTPPCLELFARLRGRSPLSRPWCRAGSRIRAGSPIDFFAACCIGVWFRRQLAPGRVRRPKPFFARRTSERPNRRAFTFSFCLAFSIADPRTDAFYTRRVDREPFGKGRVRHSTCDVPGPDVIVQVVDRVAFPCTSRGMHYAHRRLLVEARISIFAAVSRRESRLLGPGKFVGVASCPRGANLPRRSATGGSVANRESMVAGAIPGCHRPFS